MLAFEHFLLKPYHFFTDRSSNNFLYNLYSGEIKVNLTIIQVLTGQQKWRVPFSVYLNPSLVFRSNNISNKIIQLLLLYYANEQNYVTMELDQ